MPSLNTIIYGRQGVQVMSRKKKENPDLVVNHSNGAVTEVYVVDTTQYVSIREGARYTFPYNSNDKTASLVCVSQSDIDEAICEYDIDDKKPWKWLQKLAQKGADAYAKEEKEKEDK